MGLCVLFLYFAEPAYELALKFGLEFRNSEIYSKDYEEDFFDFFFSGRTHSYFFCKMKSYFSDSRFLPRRFPSLQGDEVILDLRLTEFWKFGL